MPGNKEAIFFKLGQQEQKDLEPSSEEYYKKDHHQQDIKDRKKRRRQRERLDNRVFGLLVFQVVFLVTIMLLQGFSPWGFKLNRWTFGIFVNGSLIQSYLLVRYIAADLFTAKS